MACGSIPAMTSTGARDRTTTASVAFHDVRSDDGTRLRAWTNDADGTGPTVLLGNLEP